MHDVKRGNLIWLWLSAFVIFLDQLTKHVALNHLSLSRPYHLIPSFNFTLEFNSGAAFSFLSLASGWQRPLFAVIAIIVSIVILIYLFRMKKDQQWLAAGLAFILGGALGNLWDRISLGYVVDFLDLYIKHWHWPVFNVADIAICIGVLMLAIDFLMHDKTSPSRIQ